jgi:hypothetical protein
VDSLERAREVALLARRTARARPIGARPSLMAAGVPPPSPTARRACTRPSGEQIFDDQPGRSRARGVHTRVGGGRTESLTHAGPHLVQLEPPRTSPAAPLAVTGAD